MLCRCLIARAQGLLPQTANHSPLEWLRRLKTLDSRDYILQITITQRLVFPVKVNTLLGNVFQGLPSSQADAHLTQTYFLSRLTGFGRSVKLLLEFARSHSWLQSPRDPWLRFLFSPRYVHVSKLGFLFDEGGGRSLYVGVTFYYTVVSAWAYPRCNGVQVTMTLCTLCHCTVLSNIYTRYREVSCQCRLVQQVMP
jgi:hypothetical protein